MSPRKKTRRRTEVEEILGPEDASLLDIVDNLLNKGVVLSGDVTIGLAQVDLVYARLSVLLSAADRVLPGEERAHDPERRVVRRRAVDEQERRPVTRAEPRDRRAVGRDDPPGGGLVDHGPGRAADAGPFGVHS